MTRSLPRRIWRFAKWSLLLLVGFGGYQVVAPQLRSTDHFLTMEGEPRVRYEPGAEAAARVIAQALPHAVASVEAAHARPFAEPAVVHVCATIESFERYGFGVAGAGGYVYAGRLFVSPKPQNTAERLPRLVTHELSHLHLEQRLGMLGMANGLPGWFKEGLAVVVSQGGGAENVSEDEARKAIAEGRVFRRKESGSLVFPQTASSEGLSHHLYYRESALFVAFLAQSSPEFHRLLSAIQEGAAFATAVRESYGRDIPALWDQFTAEVVTASRTTASAPAIR